jgi:hypothetical protein
MVSGWQNTPLLGTYSVYHDGAAYRLELAATSAVGHIGLYPVLVYASPTIREVAVRVSK